MTIKKKRFTKGIELKPSSLTTNPQGRKGEIDLDSDDDKLKYHDGTGTKEVVNKDDAQTLENKTIDVDNNTVSNIETDNLKTGVLITDVSTASSDTELASALSIKTALEAQNEANEIVYNPAGNPTTTAIEVQTALDNTGTVADTAQTTADDHIADAVGAHAASAISNTPSGNLAATDQQAANNELQTNIDLNTSDLADHEAEATGAHAASAIANTPSGNLAATDQQTANNELQSDIDTRALASDLTDHETETTGAHAASAISNIPSGNLAGTDQQTVNNELQTDIDSRALDSDLTDHENATAAHGTTGDVVGTTDTQTLTNKTLDGASIESPTRLDVKKDTKANLITYAGSASNGQLCFATDEKKMYQVVDTVLTEVGSGSGGSLDIIEKNDFETEASASFTSGNNAVFGAGGTLDGTLSDETTPPINGTTSIRYTASTASQFDWFKIKTVTPKQKERGETIGLTMYANLTNFTNTDVQVVVYDETNDVNLMSSVDVLQSGEGKTRYSFSFFLPDDCLSYSYGFQILGTPTDADSFIFDDFEFTLNPFVYKNLYERQEYSITQAVGSMLDASIQMRFNLGTATTYSDGAGLFTVSDDGTYTIYTANRDLKVDVIVSALQSTTWTTRTLIKTSDGRIWEGSAAASDSGDNDDHYTLAASSFLLKKDQYIFIESTNTFRASPKVQILATAQAENLITPMKNSASNFSEPETITIEGVSANPVKGTIVRDELKYQRKGQNALCNYSYHQSTGGSSSATGDYLFSLPSGLEFDDNVNLYTGALLYTNLEFSSAIIETSGFAQASTDGGTVYAIPYDSTRFRLLGYSDAGNNYASIKTGFFDLAGARSYGFTIEAPIKGWSSESQFLAAIPPVETVYISEVQASGTNGHAGATFTSGAWQTRFLNTVEGDTHLASLASDRFKPKKGKYKYKITAPSGFVNNHQARLYNFTQSSTVKAGTSEFSSTTGGGYQMTESTITGDLIANGIDEFIVEHRCATTRATNGFGDAAGFGEDETYTFVELIKVR